ncbi:MAG: carboxypeptidase regulatory-like domain-containing protein [Anaerolineae bacterium]|nr:carboxypeptidase regulatory-like domain-containing protein [Anaerolineae bacterium]
MRRRLIVRWLVIGLAVVCLALSIAGWAAVTYTRKAQALHAVLEHQIEAWWAEQSGTAIPRPEVGSIAGRVCSTAGEPLADAVVVASDRYGRAVSARTDAEGGYQIVGVPVGRTVPAAVRPGYRDQVYRAHAWLPKSAVRVRPGKTTGGVDFRLAPVEAPDSTLAVHVGTSVLVSGDYPEPVETRRTEIVVEHDGFPVTCYVYEPTAPAWEGRALPAIVAVYPGPPINWEAASTAFVAQGYVVLGFSPISMRDLDATADTDDLRVLIELLADGLLSTRVDGERIGALSGSFTSVHLLRALRQTPEVRAAVLLGGLTDAYLLRYDAYHGGYRGYEISEVMAWAMWSLGRPDLFPRLYIENSAVWHPEGLPPLCLIHSTGDEILPYNQSERFAAVLERAGQPYELYIHEGLGHYPGIYDPDPVTELMYQQMLQFLAEHLPPH